MVKPKCACGCGQRAANRHHVIYQQTLRDVARERTREVREPSPARSLARRKAEAELKGDDRNLVWLAFGCHQAHHGRSGVLPFAVLPDSVFEFAAEVLGAGQAYEYLRRRYRGTDVRLDALLEMAA